MVKIITPQILTTAALITQVIFMLIIYFGASIIRKKWEYAPSFRRGEHVEYDFTRHIFLFLMTTVISLLLSDQIMPLWHPLLRDIEFEGIRWTLSINICFIADIILITLLVGRTGGSMTSAFGPLYYIIPPLAIFLHEPYKYVYIYSSLISLSFLKNLYIYEDYLDSIHSERNRRAYCIVSILSFALSVSIGYLTRSY